MKWLNLVRYQNLILLALMQLLFRFGFLKLQNIPLALSNAQYLLLVLATLCIAAAGYVLNDIHDQDTDRVNRPQRLTVGHGISEKAAYNAYFALNIMGVACGFYLANLIGKPMFAAIFICIAGVLHLYATSLKQSLLIGNVLVALLLAFSVYIIGIFDLYPILNAENRTLLSIVFQILIDYAVFAFLINFIREIVKDLEDVDGDYNQGMNTLPIALGISRTSRIVFYLSIVPIAVLFYYINKFFITPGLYFAAIYAFALVVAPLIYFSIRLWNAKHKAEYHHLSNVLKFVLLFGILSILIVSLNIRYNA